MALLIVNFIPDAPKAAKDMRPVTKSGGVVATTMWDGSGANELNACLWEAAIPMDPIAKRTDEDVRFPGGTFRPLEWRRSNRYRRCSLRYALPVLLI
jgi:hypothetical protein